MHLRVKQDYETKKKRRRKESTKQVGVFTAGYPRLFAHHCTS